jgi:WD40 repeat protein
MANVFISHAGADTEPAVEVGKWLRAEGHEIFLDRDLIDGIKIGEDWSNRLQERLRWSDAVVCLLSAAYARSSWCTAEVAIAESHGSRLLPLTLEEGADHPLLRQLHHYDLSSNPQEARAAVGAELSELDGTGGQAWPDDLSPFPGLVAFTLEEHRAFFGRDAEVRSLLDGVRSAEQAATAVTLVVGPSGCGKSSLVMAGLMSAVGRDPEWWCLGAFVPGADPLSNLVRELVMEGNRHRLPWTAADVRARLADGNLADLATDLLVAAPGARRRRLLMVVDQFEELVTQADAAGRQEFVDALLARTAGGAVQVVGTLRPEFLDMLQADPAFAEVSSSVALVQPVARAALPSVIEGPARLAGLNIEDGLVARIVEDTESGDALPLLAFTLAELAGGVGRRGTLTHERYDELGGVQGALVKQATAAMADATAQHARTEREVLRELLRLVTVDAEGRPTRLRVPTTTLSDEAQSELKPFVERRILITGEDGDEPTIGVAHEAVLTAWPPLATAIREERVALRARVGIEETARQWAADNRSPKRLWERGQLATALHDVGAPPGGPDGSERVELSAQAREFLRLSVRRDRFRRGRLSLVLGALLVLAVAGGLYAVAQRNAALDQSNLTLSRSLIAQAEAARGTDDRTALQLGIAAEWRRPDRTTAASLIQTLSSTHYARTLPVPSGAAAAAFTHGGQLMAIGSVAGLVQLWDTTDPLRPTVIGAPLDGQVGAVYSVEFSPDGHTLAVAGGAEGKGRAALWDVTKPAAPRRLPDLARHTNVVHAATFSPDGRTLVTVGFDNQVLLWDVTDPSRPSPIGAPLTAHTDRVNTAVFSPDGRALATGGFDNQVLLWDVTDPRQPALIGPVPDGPVNAVWALAWSGPTLAAASADGTVRLWDAGNLPASRSTGDPISLGAAQAYTVAFSPDGTHLITGGTDRVIALWDLADRAHPKRIEALTGHADYVYGVAFRDGATLVSGSADGTAVVWDLSARPALAAVEPLPGPAAEAYAAATTPDGRTLITGTADGRIAVTDIGTGRLIASVGTGRGAVRSLAVTPDRSTLVVGGDAGVGLWDITDAAQPHLQADVSYPGPRIYSVAVSSDGHTLATGGDETVVRLWDITDRVRPVPRGELTGHTGAVFALRFGGTRLAAGSADNTVILWDVRDPGRPTPVGDPLGGHAAPVYSVAFSPDGTIMATGGQDGSVQLWDVVSTGQARPFGQQPASGRAAVLTTGFAADGRTLAAGYADGQVALWDLTEPGHPRPFGPDLASPTAVNSVVFPRGTATLVTAARTDTVRLWDLTRVAALQADPVGQACAAVGDGLDQSRWATYLPGVPYTATCPPSNRATG